MKILLLGEYSNVHYTLATALRQLGHTVVLASDGDNWKNYPRDVDLRRYSLKFKDTVTFLGRTIRHFMRFRGYDVVQIINPLFLPLRPEHIWPFYAYLRRHNRKIVLGAFGMDYYYIKACLDCKTFRYSDFNIGSKLRKNSDNDAFLKEWYRGEKGMLNQRVAKDADAIVAGLYEYYAAYHNHFPDTQKLHFISFPVSVDETGKKATQYRPGDRVKFFIGIQSKRSAYKGTDIMSRALSRIERKYPEYCEVKRVSDLPFQEYTRTMYDSHIILDQLYSYTPAMNALEAMSRGLITVGGGEEEMYHLINETELRPIVNVEPTEESVYENLKKIVEQRDTLIPRLQIETKVFIRRHHELLHVARQYESLYRRLLADS